MFYGAALPNLVRQFLMPLISKNLISREVELTKTLFYYPRCRAWPIFNKAQYPGIQSSCFKLRSHQLTTTS